MQVCTSLQTDNHAITPPLCFLQAGCPSCRPTNSVKALIPSRQITYWRHPSDIHQQGTGCQIPLSGRPLSRHYEILSRFPDSLQHSCPCCVTDFKHVFLSVLPVYYNATEKFSKLTLQKILLKWQYESETANDNIDVAPNLRQAMDSFP